MREIKFRAWDKECKFMRYGAENSLLVCLNNPSDFEVMQYTGLHDKNSKEIYEGDILLYPNGEKIAVIWMGYPASFSPCEETNITEVIGNIYENKELLNGIT